MQLEGFKEALSQISFFAALNYTHTHTFFGLAVVVFTAAWVFFSCGEQELRVAVVVGFLLRWFPVLPWACGLQ